MRRGGNYDQLQKTDMYSNNKGVKNEFIAGNDGAGAANNTQHGGVGAAKKKKKRRKPKMQVDMDDGDAAEAYGDQYSANVSHMGDPEDGDENDHDAARKMFED